MASPVAPEPNRRNAPATPKGHNRLALTSFLLSLAPLVALVLAYLVGDVLFQVLNQRFPNALTSDAINAIVGWVDLVLYIGSLLASISAIVTGWRLALSPAKQYPPQQARTGLAVAGVVIGVAGTTLLIFLGLLLGLVLYVR